MLRGWLTIRYSQQAERTAEPQVGRNVQVRCRQGQDQLPQVRGRVRPRQELLPRAAWSVLGVHFDLLRCSRTLRCSSVPSEKQTFEYNVRVRAEFKKTVHARMGAYLAPTPLGRRPLILRFRDLGSDREAKHARGRLRPRRAYLAISTGDYASLLHLLPPVDRSIPDRAPFANCRGDPQRRKARVDAGRRPSARPWQAPLLLRIRVRSLAFRSLREEHVLTRYFCACQGAVGCGRGVSFSAPSTVISLITPVDAGHVRGRVQVLREDYLP